MHTWDFFFILQDFPCFIWHKFDKFLVLKLVGEGNKTGQKCGGEEGRTTEFIQGLSYSFLNPQYIVKDMVLKVLSKYQLIWNEWVNEYSTKCAR